MAKLPLIKSLCGILSENASFSCSKKALKDKQKDYRGKIFRMEKSKE
jgi:hypothetical protein